NVREFFTVYHVNPQDVYGKKLTVVGLATQAGLLKGYEKNHERKGKAAIRCAWQTDFRKLQALDSFSTDYPSSATDK
ncbi:MAG: hypothetical protein ACYCVD_19545, partial [Desulfitobacteriaceae bacterium]